MEFPKQVTIVSVPYKHVFEFPSEPGQSPSGADGKFLDILARGLKFEYSLVHPADGEWGDFRNGSWTGAIGTLVREEADLAIAILGVSYERQKVIDFTVPYGAMNGMFATFFPKEMSRTYAFIYPFDAITWIVLSTLLVVIPLLWHALRGNSYPLLLLETFGNFLGKSVGRTDERKGFVAFWLLVAMVLSTSYVCVLPSFLFVPLREQPVTTFKLLSEKVSRGEFAVCIWKGTQLLRSLLMLPSEDLMKIGREIERRQWFRREDGSCSYAFGHKTAFMGGRMFLELEFGQPPDSNMLFSTDEIMFTPIAIGVRKRFCCKKMIDRTVRRIFESGVLQHILKQEIFKKKTEILKDDRERRDRVQMKIDNILGPLLVLFIGHATSAFLLTLELLHKKFCPKK